MNISKEELSGLRRNFPEGTRVRLIMMNDEQAPPAGTLGIVRCVDDIGTVHVAWDTGSSLGVIFGEDEIEVASLGGCV